MIIHKIKKFLLSFDEGLDRKNFAFLFLPCLLFLFFIGLVAIMALEVIPSSFHFLDWILVLAFLPLILLGACLFLIVYALIYTPVFFEEWDSVGSVLKWLGIYIFGIILLPTAIISYLFCLLTIKRLNDLKLNRKWILLSLVPFVNWLFLGYLLLKDSKKDS